MFKTYTGWQWLLIDAANQFGHDKLTFELRIKWAEATLPVLEAFTDDADKKPLYIKAVMAIRKAQAGLPTGHMVAVDSVCSGMQIMSAMTGCISGATATGLIDPNVRADAYTEVTKVMQTTLGTSFTVSRADAKESIMTSLYGSKAVPKRIFGEDTPEIDAFYAALNQVCPGAWELLQDLLGAWKPYALSHEWKMPDGFDVKVKVMEKAELRINVEEMGSSFTYEYMENVGTKTGLSLAANVVHSVDGMIVREMHRRCNYDLEMVTAAASLIEGELVARPIGHVASIDWKDGPAGTAYYVEQYNRSGLASVVILPHLDLVTASFLSTKHLVELAIIVEGMLKYKPFELITIHDSFASSPNNVNWVRYNYKEILAEMADSRLLDDLLTQLYGQPGVFKKYSTGIGKLIRQSNYSLS